MWDTWEWKRESMPGEAMVFLGVLSNYTWASPCCQSSCPGTQEEHLFPNILMGQGFEVAPNLEDILSRTAPPHRSLWLSLPAAPSPFPPSPEHVGHHLQQMMQMLQMTDCAYPSFPFTVLPGHLLSPLVLVRALYLLCPWSLDQCLLISRSNLWMRDVWIFNKQRSAN